MKELLNLSLEHGVAGVCVLLTLGIFLKVGEFVWGIIKEKRQLSDDSVKALTTAMQENTIAAQNLDTRLKTLEQNTADLPKFKTDIRRFYAAIKEVAGDRWPQIRDEILKDDFFP